MTRRAIDVIALWTLLAMMFYATVPGTPARAAWLMTVGLIVIWVCGFGYVSYRCREYVARYAARIPGSWHGKFISASMILILVEEAVATLLTNLAPLFGVGLGGAYLTASAQYVDVILFHSAAVFVPMVLVWTWLFSRYDFSPESAFLLFGISGLLAEVITFGPESFIQGYWIPVYGLMVYLPATMVPASRVALRPGVFTHIFAVALPLIAAIPVGVAMRMFHPIANHFLF